MCTLYAYITQYQLKGTSMKVLIPSAKTILGVIVLGGMLMGSMAAHAQIVSKIKSHIEADPLTFSGSMGTTLQSLFNNRDVYSSGSPFALTAYANFNIGIYGFNIPININLMNIAATQFSFPRPQININMTPQWKNFRFHIGTSSMHFSNYTYSGQNFTGLGMEYQGKVFRASGFYGTMQAATRFKEYDNRSAIRYLADSLLGLNVHDYDLPQYKRVGYGAKIGVGNAKNYLDLSLFKAKDDTNSLPMTWYNAGGDTIHRDSMVFAKENLTIGLSGRVSAGKWFTLTANAGASLYTPDEHSSAINNATMSTLGADSTDAQMAKIMGVLDKVGWLYTPRMNSQLRFAGDASASFNFSRFNAVLTYRMVQADYTSLGATRFSQNAHGLGANTNIRMFKNTTTLSLAGYLQRDNLDHKQIFTNQVATYSTNLSTLLFNALNMSVAYSGVSQYQLDGTKQVNDSTRTNQLAHNVTVSPSYTIEGDNSHNISLNFNTVQNRNMNKLNPNKSKQDVSTYTVGAGYMLTLTALRMDVGVNYDYSKSISVANSYTAHAFGGSFNYIIAKTDKINLRANYMMSISFNKDETGSNDNSVTYDPSDPENTAKTNSISFSNRLGATFSYKQLHNASLYLSSSNYSDNIVIGQHISTDFDLRINFSYSYSFAKRIIKSKKKKADDEENKATLEG